MSPRTHDRKAATSGPFQFMRHNDKELSPAESRVSLWIHFRTQWLKHVG